MALNVTFFTAADGNSFCSLVLHINPSVWVQDKSKLTERYAHLKHALHESQLSYSAVKFKEIIHERLKKIIEKRRNTATYRVRVKGLIQEI